MQHDAVGKFKTGIEKKLPDSFADLTRIILRHEWITVPDYRIFHLAQTVLQAFTSRTVDVAASLDLKPVLPRKCVLWGNRPAGPANAGSFGEPLPARVLQIDLQDLDCSSGRFVASTPKCTSPLMGCLMSWMLRHRGTARKGSVGR